MGKSIGIDLGTTNSVMCIMHTEPEILLNRENKRLTPSAVAFRRSKKAGDLIIVGENAVKAAKAARKDYLYSIKRLMGLPYNDPNVAEVRSTVSYDIEPSPDGEEDEVRVSMGGTLYEPKEISAMILKKLKEDAEMRLGDTVDSAVITVPAYFSERQKNATREAGLLAGLKVKKLIDEPTAAAIAYGIDQNDDQDRMVLVFDVGGGTFDVSILLMVGGIFSQMDNEGDMWLGGDNFDGLIMAQVIREVEKEHGLTGLSENKEFTLDLKPEARQAKEVLSSQDSAEIMMSDALKDEEGMPLPVEFEITRSEFEGMMAPYVEKAMACVREALTSANMEKEDIDAVLMVGGSSTIPSFQRAVEEFFGREKVLKGVDPMGCVAQGAAILAKSLGGIFCPGCGHENPIDAAKCAGCNAELGAAASGGGAEAGEEYQAVAHVSRTPKPYGIEIEGNRFEEIIPKNAIYPTEEPHVKTFRTLMHGQRLIKLPLREGFSAAASDNSLMGNIWFYDLPPGLPLGTSIDIAMALDGDGIFTISAGVRGTDWRRESKLVRDKWENDVLDEAMDTHVEMQRREVKGADAEEAQTRIKGIQDAVASGDREAATQYRDALQEMKAKWSEETPEEPPAAAIDNWRQSGENVAGLGTGIIQRIRPILPPGKNAGFDTAVAAFDAWAGEMKTAIAMNDEANGPRLAQDGIPKLFAVPLAGDLALGELLSRHPEIDPTLQQQLQQSGTAFYAAVDARNGDQINTELTRFRDYLQKAMAQLGQSGGTTDDKVKVLLGR
jgi:molecular chaperone DnaK (HSP70)